MSPTTKSEIQNPKSASLSPPAVRAMVYLVLVLIGLGSIWLIDTRAIQRMHELDAEVHEVQPAEQATDVRRASD